MPTNTQSRTVINAAISVVVIAYAYNIQPVACELSFSPPIADSSMNTINVNQASLEVRTIGVSSPTNFVPKTERGRRLLELRQLAEKAGEEFFSSTYLLEELRLRRQ